MKHTNRTVFAFTVVSLIFFVVGSARADWYVGDGHKMHFPQLPDLDTTGMDVLNNAPYPGAAVPTAKILADDWQCSASGPVTDIHIWGSYLEDVLPTRQVDGLIIDDPENVAFRLSIHADIPADAAGGYSRPGEKLWERLYSPMHPGWTSRLYESNVLESFYDPNTNEIIGVDTEVYQYNFFVDPEDAFQQEQGTIYWLEVVAAPLDLQAVFGWKTSLDHFNDDAVWGDVFGVDPDPSADPQEWFELRYPTDHQFQGQSIDLAFVITPEPATLSLLAIGGVALLKKRSGPSRKFCTY